MPPLLATAVASPTLLPPDGPSNLTTVSVLVVLVETLVTVLVVIRLELFTSTVFPCFSPTHTPASASALHYTTPYFTHPASDF